MNLMASASALLQYSGSLRSKDSTNTTGAIVSLRRPKLNWLYGTGQLEGGQPHEHCLLLLAISRRHPDNSTRISSAQPTMAASTSPIVSESTFEIGILGRTRRQAL